MYFQKLENLSQGETFNNIYPIIDSLDTWLAFLPQSYRDRITPEQFTYKQDISSEIVYNIFDRLVDLNMLKERYVVTCQEDGCNHVLYMANGLKDLKKYIEEFNSNRCECDFCEKISNLDSDYIFIIYELIDEPKENYVKKNLFNDFDMETTERKSLSDLIKDKPQKYKDGLGEENLKTILAEDMLAFVLDD